jgi:hypothetical protein
MPHAEQVQAGPGEQDQPGQLGRERGDPRGGDQDPGQQAGGEEHAEPLEDGVVV